MLATALSDLWYGFGVAFEPQNLMWCFVGVLVGNMVGVLPGMGPLATISVLLPLTATRGISPAFEAAALTATATAVLSAIMMASSDAAAAKMAFARLLAVSITVAEVAFV